MKAVIFDVDGTLVDSNDFHAEAWKIAFARFGHEFATKKIRDQIGKGGDQLLPAFLSKSEITALGEEIEDFRGRLFRKHFLRKIRPFPRVRALFSCLKQDGWKLAIASSSNKKDLLHLIRLCRVEDLLDVTISADDVKKSKPHPDIFLAAVDALDVPRRDCWVIGDSPYDGDAAKRSRLRSVGFLSGGFPRAWLKRSGMLTMYHSPADFLQRYARSPLARTAAKF